MCNVVLVVATGESSLYSAPTASFLSNIQMYTAEICNLNFNIYHGRKRPRGKVFFKKKVFIVSLLLLSLLLLLLFALFVFLTGLLQLSVKVFPAFSLKSSIFPSNFSKTYVFQHRSIEKTPNSSTQVLAFCRRYQHLKYRF